MSVLPFEEGQGRENYKGEEAWGKCTEGCWEILGHLSPSRAPVGTLTLGGWCGPAGQAARISQSQPETA